MEKEKKEKKEQEEKASKGIKTTPIQITLIVGLLIVIAAFGGWVIGASYVATKVNANANSVKSTNVKNNNCNCDCAEQTTNTNDNQNTNNNKAEEIKPLDLNKSLNTSDVGYSNPKELSDGREEIGVSVKKGNSLTLVIDWTKFGPHSGASAWGDATKEYEIRNLSGTVKEAVVAGMGQDSVGTTVFYLMNDGTVEYTRMFVKKTDQAGHTYYSMNYTYEKGSEGKVTGEHFESEGKVSDVKDVVKLYSVEAHSGMFGYVTVIGATRDGSFYDLNKIQFE